MDLQRGYDCGMLAQDRVLSAQDTALISMSGNSGVCFKRLV